MTFSFFLSIYSRCGALASWAARHTTVCLDRVFLYRGSTNTSVHEQYFCNLRELYEELLPSSRPFSLKTKVKESRYEKFRVSNFRIVSF